jgi:hypothetical protein
MKGARESVNIEGRKEGRESYKNKTSKKAFDNTSREN